MIPPMTARQEEWEPYVAKVNPRLIDAVLLRTIDQPSPDARACRAGPTTTNSVETPTSSTAMGGKQDLLSKQLKQQAYKSQMDKEK